MSQPVFNQCSSVARHARRAVLWVALVLLVGAAPVGRLRAAAATPEFHVIVHADNTHSPSREFLTDVYLKRATRWSDGEVARPVDQRATSGVRQKFSDAILKRSVSAMKRYWQQKIFSGRELPPPELDSDEAVVLYVATHRGAVGYVSGSARLDRVKVVAVH